MFRASLERGLWAGAVGGLAFGLFVAVVGNPLVHHVETLAGTHGAHDHSLVSTATTDLVSVGGGVLWGMLLGLVIFGAVGYLFEPVLPGAPATKSALVGAAGFVTVSVAPWLALPPRPAGVEPVLSTGTRLAVYGGMVVAGALACALAIAAYNRLTARGVGRPIAACAGLAALGLLAVPATLAPAAASTGSVPADAAAAYQGFVVFGQAVLWFVLATAHAWLGGFDTGDAPTESFDDAVDFESATTAD